MGCAPRTLLESGENAAVRDSPTRVHGDSQLHVSRGLQADAFELASKRFAETSFRSFGWGWGWGQKQRRSVCTDLNSVRKLGKEKVGD